MKRKSDFNRIVSNISETLTNETLIKYVSNNVQLQNIIKKQLEIAFFMLKNNSSTKNEEKLRKISNSFANKYNVKINENLTFSEIEIIDETNSLIIFLKNLCNFDLEKKQYINNNKEIVIDSDNKNNSSINNFNNFLSNFSNDEASVIKNVAIKQIILEKLKQEKENGTIYIYKTKPKKIIYLK
jgi:hypothetical protein